MKMIINEDSISKIKGKFVIELDNDQLNFDVTTSKNPDFWYKKRISFISSTKDGYCASGFYYSHKEPCNSTEFIKWFNEHRNHRLMTTNELKWLFELIAEKNY